MEMAMGSWRRVQQRSAMLDDHHDLECINRREPIIEMAIGIGGEGSSDRQCLTINILMIWTALREDVHC